MSDSPVTSGGTGTAGVVVYWITPNVRVVRRRVPPGEAGVFIDGRKPVIQQAWMGSDGTIDWRDVPIVDEP